MAASFNARYSFHTAAVTLPREKFLKHFYAELVFTDLATSKSPRFANFVKRHLISLSVLFSYTVQSWFVCVAVNAF
jgi:hypothetical protein